MTIVLQHSGTAGPLPPLSSISVRRHGRGPESYEVAKLEPKTLLRETVRFLIFIHGYNNSKWQAEHSYTVFRARLSKLTGLSQVGFYWPGENMRKIAVETSPPGRFTFFFSALFYNRQVDKAKYSAVKLANAINAEFNHRQAQSNIGLAPPRLEINIVAHSLGCRVALEFLKELHRLDRAKISFPLVALMAAAVPHELVERSGDLSVGFRRPDNVVVYSSTGDRALGMFFRIGQWPNLMIKQALTFRGQGALGLTGVEADDQIHRRHKEDRDHHEYWPSEEIATEVQDYIANGSVPRDPRAKLSVLERFSR
jgi:esterase/lipase superfamily enzyme